MGGRVRWTVANAYNVTSADRSVTGKVTEHTENEAIAWLTTTSITKNLPLRDYISQFKNHVALSEITHEDTLINFFSRGIPAPLMK